MIVTGKVIKTDTLRQVTGQTGTHDVKQVVIKEIGKYGNEFVVTLFGDDAHKQFAPLA